MERFGRDSEMSQSFSNLEKIESSTLNHYDSNAAAFFEGTIGHDVSQNYAAFLGALNDEGGLDILDFGCGPGRDLKYFKDIGHRPVGLDGSGEFCKMARDYVGCDVLHQSFLNLTLPEQAFHGVFANASLFHVPRAKLNSVLKKLHSTLRPNGILFMSNPRGEGEGWSGQRYGNYMEYEVILHHLNTAQFEPLHHYYRPSGMPRQQQPWLAIVSQRSDVVTDKRAES
jgi:SAM-dependent methyltransferase